MKEYNSDASLFRILGFNIGNTNTMLGIYSGNSIMPERIFSYKTNKRTNKTRLQKNINDILAAYSRETEKKILIKGAALSSVVTELDSVYRQILQKLFKEKPVEISSKINTGFEILYDNPLELGADRISNAAAAYHEHKKDSIIIDFGTALTFSIIRANGVFVGGLISPGIGTAMDALADKTSRLFKVGFEKPEDIIATNTKDAIKSGYFYSSISVIEGIIKKIKNKYKKEFLIILTGGLSEIISPYIEFRHILDPLLIMKGINYIYDLNI